MGLRRAWDLVTRGARISLMHSPEAERETVMRHRASVKRGLTSAPLLEHYARLFVAAAVSAARLWRRLQPESL